VTIIRLASLAWHDARGTDAAGGESGDCRREPGCGLTEVVAQDRQVEQSPFGAQGVDGGVVVDGHALVGDLDVAVSVGYQAVDAITHHHPRSTRR
jgi:hypothetical protein